MRLGYNQSAIPIATRLCDCVFLPHNQIRTGNSYSGLISESDTAHGHSFHYPNRLNSPILGLFEILIAGEYSHPESELRNSDYRKAISNSLSPGTGVILFLNSWFRHIRFTNYSRKWNGDLFGWIPARHYLIVIPFEIEVGIAIPNQSISNAVRQYNLRRSWFVPWFGNETVTMQGF